MKHKLKLLLVPLLALALTACGGLEEQSGGSVMHDQSSQGFIVDNNSDAAGETSSIPEGALVDQSGDFVYAGKLQQIGDDENGYMKVPLGYLRFQDEDVEGLTQYSDTTGKNILTLEHYTIPYQDAANNMLAYLQSENVIQDMQGATATVADYNSLQLYGHYDDGYYIVIWFIEDPANPEGSSYYLAIEFDSEHKDIVACSSSFQTAEDFHKTEGKSEE
ncbi:MAG: hypothetical protein J5851_10840 [Oscillospiraceae bacterium]|nr:hypothetical protein [Oscillospiraceae bacterium]